jgi:hypothetical protein
LVSLKRLSHGASDHLRSQASEYFKQISCERSASILAGSFGTSDCHEPLMALDVAGEKSSSADAEGTEPAQCREQMPVESTGDWLK